MLPVSNRGATPVLAIARTSYSGFLRCSGVGRRARTFVGPTRLRLVEPPLQALKNAPKGQRFSHPPPPHPSHSYRVRAGKPKKPSAFRGEAHASLANTRICIDLMIVLIRVACTAPRSAEGFSGRRPLARAAVRGVRRRPGNERAPEGQRCLALAKRSGLAQPKAQLAGDARVRARPGRRSIGKTRSSPCSISRHGRRTAIDIG